MEGVTGFENVWWVLTDIMEVFSLRHVEVNEIALIRSVYFSLLCWIYPNEDGLFLSE